MHVSPGFEPLQQAFADATAGKPGGSALAVTVRGEQVLSTWRGESAPGVAWSEDTPAVLMSTTKGFAGMCMQILVDRGQIDVDAPVTKYWPEYGANGKHETLVSHVLLHTAGVLGWAEACRELHPDGTGWTDLDLIADRLAAAPPSWKPGTKHGYHAVSYGWLTNELVRRVTGQTMGQFFHAEVAEPLGLGTAIGVDEQRFKDVAKIHAEGLFEVPFPMSAILKRAQKRMRVEGNLLSLAFLGNGTTSIMDTVGTALDSPGFLSAEVPSSNGISSAKDVARVFAVLANGGQQNDTRILSERITAEWALPVQMKDEAVMSAMGTPLDKQLQKKMGAVRTYGYVSNARGTGMKVHYGPTPGAFGSEGAGGQIGFADPVNNVSFALVRTDLTASPKLNHQLVDTLYACLGR